MKIEETKETHVVEVGCALKDCKLNRYPKVYLRIEIAEAFMSSNHPEVEGHKTLFVYLEDKEDA